jgi:hypothetical protein
MYVKKFAVCSDIGLEGRFRRMSSQKIEQYHEDLLKSFYKMVDIVIEEKINFLFIIGNLFGKVKPMNATLNTVLECFTKLTKKKIDVFILPGNLETPLFTTRDIHALEIYRSNSRIHVLYDNNFMLEKTSKEIISPFYSKKVQGIDFKIYSTPNPLIPPHQFDFNLDVAGEECELFFIGDLSTFKKKEAQSKMQEAMMELDQNPLTAIFIGGNVPNSLDISKMENKVIHCPQINANNFEFAQTFDMKKLNPAKHEYGIKIMDYDPTDQSFSNIRIIPISDLEIERIMVNLKEIKSKQWDEEIKTTLQKNSNLSKFVRLQLEGKISRDTYHKFLSIYQYFDIGRVRNFHFELEDRIEFNNAAADISDLRIMDELLNYKNYRVEEITNGDFESKNSSNIELIYRKAMEKIKLEYQGGEIE